MQVPGQQDNQAENGYQSDQDDRDDRGRQMQDGRRTHTRIFVSGASAVQKVDRGESPPAAPERASCQGCTPQPRSLSANEDLPGEPRARQAQVLHGPLQLCLPGDGGGR